MLTSFKLFFHRYLTTLLSGLIDLGSSKKETTTMYKPILLLACLFLLCCSTLTQEQEQKNKPLQNVLLLISDDHAAYALGCYGNKVIRTPNIDRLASEGTRFERAYANSPMCSASRASFITGKYAHATRTTLLRTALPASETTLAEHLKAMGYATGSFGKNHFNSSLKHGYDTLVNNGEHQAFLETQQALPLVENTKVRPKWKPFRDHSRIWLNAEGATSGLPYEMDQGTFFAKSGIEFLRKHKEEKSFTVVSFREPHSPFNFPIEFAGKYDPKQMPMPETSVEDERWIPDVFHDLTEEERRGIVRSYYTSVEFMDKNVGLVLNSLKEMDLEENTLVVYIGDHGYLLDHHKRFEKHMMWEEAIRVPLIIRGGAQGKVVSQMVELVDLVPTILDMIGASAKSDVQGKSLAPLINGRATEHKPYIFSEFLADNKAMVRTDDWKLIFTSGKDDLKQGYVTKKGPSGLQYRLYNMKTDPMEHHNVIDDTNNQNIFQILQNQLLNHYKKHHPDAQHLPKDLNKDEQLTWFTEPPEGQRDDW